MTTDEVVGLVDEYAAAVEAELALLGQLADVARDQHEASAASDFDAFNRIADRRDALMRGLVTVEEDLRRLRGSLTPHRDLAQRVSGYDAITRRHREASELVNGILATDRQAISALADAELARRSAMASLEKGETTLAAYRRVLSPPVSNARLVDKLG